MTLTHDKVRSLLDEERAQLLFDWIVESGGDPSLLSDVLQVSRALADEWLAARTVRWANGGIHDVGAIRRVGGGFVARKEWQSTQEGIAFDTYEQAAAQVEQWAHEAGYEVAK